MPVYKYVAMNAHKQKVKGKFIAENEKDLASALAKNNLYLLSSSLYKEGTPSAFFTVGTGKVSMKDLTAFCRQFSIMLTAGITVLECLESLKRQSYTAYFRSILQVVYDDVKGGEMLSGALDKHAKVFPNFFRSMVHVGEASGRLAVVFVSLADYYESDAAIKRKAKAALAYPMMLLGLTVGIVILMFAFVIPTFKNTMGDMGVEITGFTKTVYDISDFLMNWWNIIVLLILLIAGLLFLFLKTQKGKYAFDVFKVKCPLVGRIQIDIVTARFSRAFGILLSSGMDLSSALDAVAMILGNRYLQRRFEEASESVRHGYSLTNALGQHDLFPDMLIQMIAVGEKTAALDDVLSRSCNYFDERVEASLNSLTSKIQPIMLMIMGGVVGSLFLAVYSPILSMMTQLSAY